MDSSIQAIVKLVKLTCTWPFPKTLVYTLMLWLKLKRVVYTKTMFCVKAIVYTKRLFYKDRVMHKNHLLHKNYVLPKPMQVLFPG